MLRGACRTPAQCGRYYQARLIASTFPRARRRRCPRTVTLSRRLRYPRSIKVLVFRHQVTITQCASQRHSRRLPACVCAANMHTLCPPYAMRPTRTWRPRQSDVIISGYPCTGMSLCAYACHLLRSSCDVQFDDLMQVRWSRPMRALPRCGAEIIRI